MTTSSGPTGFLGLSHLGIISSAGWSSFGQPTIAVHPDEDLISRLGRGDLPIHEPGLPELLQRSRDCLTFSADLSSLSQCPLVIVSLDVPTDEHNVSSVEAVPRLIDAAAPHLRQDVILVVMSQVQPGFTRALGQRLRSSRPDLSFQLYYLVETLIFGDAVRRCLEPERFIVGCADPRVELPAVWAEGLKRFGCPILPMRYESAELTKTAINLYLIGSVTYANTLSNLCESIGADWSEMTPALKLDARIGPAAYLKPSLGIAGGNLERDLVTLRDLCEAHDQDASYLEALIEFNARRLEWVQRKVEQLVFAEGSSKPTLAIWGLTYKKDTRSTKNSPALRLLPSLASRATLRAWDPAIGAAEVDLPVDFASDRDDALRGADGVLIMADWDQFAEADLDRIRRDMRRPLVLDCVGVLERRRAEMDGIEYVTMGIGA